MPTCTQSIRSVLFSVLVVAGACAAPAARAASAAPALVDASQISLRDDLAWLADRGLISLGLGTWPLPVPLIAGALEARTAGAWPAADRDALERIVLALSRADRDVSAGWRANTARHPSIGADGAARAEHLAYAQMLGTDEASATAWRLRANAQYHPTAARQASGFTLDGSYVAATLGDAVVSFGAIDRWWGPARYASPVLGNAAPPIPALSLRRASDAAPTSPWLSWVGRWSYELSIGRPSQYEPRGASTIGIRLSTRPAAGLELGLSRYIYWGGAGRPRSLGSLGDALLANSNIDDPAIDGPDPSNEIAGIDLRWALPLGRATWVTYGHFVGEDEADAAPSKLMATVGAQLKHASEAHRFEWTAEGSDTRLGRLFGLGNDNRQIGYQHSTFVDGHYHRGLPNGAFIGGGGLVYSLGLVVVPTASAASMRYEARVWAAKVSEFGFERLNAAYGPSGKVHGLMLQSSGQTEGWRWNLGLSMQRYPEGGRRSTGLVGGIERSLQR